MKDLSTCQVCEGKIWGKNISITMGRKSKISNLIDITLNFVHQFPTPQL
jgi:hypothetical protein